MRAWSVIFTPWYTSYRSLRPRRMEMVSSTVGSETSTGWEASFSMYWRYSLRVVAPMQWSSPRASRGFKRFPASMLPSVLPAPTMVWSSSMKRMIRPSLFLISVRTAFSRSSNSPRNLAPAMRAPISRLKIFRSRRFWGTSPATMRRANPSAMAVLPTPGSPISTGLFLVLRLRMRMTLRISLSRPITGSSLWFFASSTRSWPYLANTS